MRTDHLMRLASRGLGQLHRWRGVVSRVGVVRWKFGCRCQWWGSLMVVVSSPA